MYFLLIVNSSEAEVKWNALRFGIALRNAGETVTIFLNGAATRFYEGETEQLPLRKLAADFCQLKGIIAACGTSMNMHGVQEDEYIKLSNLKSLYAATLNADRILSY